MIGETLGNYRVDSQIGSGGMGIVYSAEHVLLGKRAAIKVLKPERCESQEIVNRFFNEARAAAMIKHPGIPEIFDYGHLPDGNAYIIMEMLEGATLGSVLEGRTRLTPGRSLALARLMAGTLKATHEAGIIHRDLKPDNVFVVPDAAMPRGERIQILDFGIAKLQGNAGDSSVQTETGRLMGTPFYMSPEQCRGAGNIDHRTDIYSLGCVLYQMLCGRPPFAMRGSGEILAAHIHLVPQAPREIEASVPERLESLVLKMLSKDPGDRPQSMQDVISELNQIATMAKMDTPEPSLATSMEMPLHLIQREDNSMMDTLDDFDSAFGNTHDSHSSETDNVLLLDKSRVQEVGTAAIRHPPNRFRQIVLPLAVALGVSAGAWTMWTLLKESKNQTSTTDETAVSDPVPTPAPTPLIVRELVEVEVPSKAASLPEEVSLQVNSDPQGATVFRVSDGVSLGKTPVVIQVRRGEGVMNLLIRKRGYKSARIELPVSEDAVKAVSLSRKGKGTAEPKGDLDVKVPIFADPDPDPVPKSRRGQIDNQGKSRVGTWTE